MSKASEIVLECIENKKLTQTELAARVGEDRRNMNEQLRRQNDMKFDRVTKLVEASGYRLAVEETGINIVDASYGLKVVETGSPFGKFIYEENGEFFAVNTTEGKLDIKASPTKEEAFGWLQTV